MKHSILGAACASLFIALSGAAQAASVGGQGTWESTLQGRDLDGNLSTAEAYYDTVLGITWLANADYIGGYRTWRDATNWVNGLTLGGYTDWRLPTTTDTGALGCDWSLSGTDCGYNVDAATSEMASMYYDTLGNLGYSSPGWGLTNTGDFSNVQSFNYWSSTVYEPDAWYFTPGNGGQNYSDKTYHGYAWAVHTGDVGASVVPVPAAAWLFGSGLLGLIGVSRKRMA